MDETALVTESSVMFDIDAAIAANRHRRGAIRDFIVDTFTMEIDFGVIHGSRGDKRILLKPGAEKITEMLGLTALFERDTETWQMAGQTIDCYCYRCRLFDASRDQVAEGRGVAELKERDRWTRNSAVKMAEKRAFVDAVLRAAALSEMFTQDLEDDIREAATGGARPDEGVPASTPDEARREIRTLQKELGYSDAAFNARIAETHQGRGLAQLTMAELERIADPLRRQLAERRSERQP